MEWNRSKLGERMASWRRMARSAVHEVPGLPRLRRTDLPQPPTCKLLYSLYESLLSVCLYEK
eukprot:scaffold824_cov129-Cylindrotheca_fusiformis.AAC.4